MHACICTNIYIQIKIKSKGNSDEEQYFCSKDSLSTGENVLAVDFFSPEPQLNFTKPNFQHGLHAIAFITFSHCVLMYKGKDYSTASKYSVLKGG